MDQEPSTAASKLKAAAVFVGLHLWEGFAGFFVDGWRFWRGQWLALVEWSRAPRWRLGETPPDKRPDLQPLIYRLQDGREVMYLPLGTKWHPLPGDGDPAQPDERLPRDFRRATLRGVLPPRMCGDVGLSFDRADGAVVRLVIDGRSADGLLAALEGYAAPLAAESGETQFLAQGEELPAVDPATTVPLLYSVAPNSDGLVDLALYNGNTSITLSPDMAMELGHHIRSAARWQANAASGSWVCRVAAPTVGGSADTNR